ncbi:LOW QUALITY PROTEIN: hypothetical protein N665_0139s0074 [Sinapis alba]|nr:LOW QUALITY PROTEIN: hypothetical protein N665_0139s0074 [Sinapis alba]
MKSDSVLFKPKSSSPAKISFPTCHRASPDEAHFISLIHSCKDTCSVRHFIMMLRLGVRPDRLTFPFVLKSNSKLGFRWLGKALHAASVKDCVDCDSFVRVSLVDMYGKTKGLKYALQVFEESPERLKKESVLLWNVLINGYCRAKDMQMAKTLFGSMPERNSGSWSTLIKGYVDSGELNRAKQCFELMPEKNVVSWTTLVNGFSQNGEYETAISVYFDMVEKGMKPNEYTIAAVLSACSKSGALESGIRAYGYVLNNGFKLDRAIGTALVDMYAKCEAVDCAANVFSNMGVKDILSWTAMIQGWATHGRFQKAILCFRQMMYLGEKPDEVVFLAVLTACLNSGEVDLGINFFDSMRLDYAIEPMLKHYVTVDLLGRAGKLNEAHELIESMPINPDLTTWVALYRACKAHNSNRKGEMVSQNLLEIDPELRGSYIFLDKRYAAKGKLQDVEKRRLPLRKIGKKSFKGWSYIELDGQLNKFVAGDDSHKQVKEIRLKLEEIVLLAVERGYIPGADWSIHDIEEEEKENVTGIHSEKLALALGLPRTAPGTVIRIVKNLRICGDSTNESFVLRKYYFSLLKNYEQIYFFRSNGQSPPDSLQNPSTGAGLMQGAIRPPQELLALTYTPQPRIDSRDLPGGLNSFSLFVSSMNGSLDGPIVNGLIDGKFEDGYLITVKIGTEELKGVLYELVPQQSHGSLHNNAISQGITGGVTKRRRRRKKSEIKRRDPAHPKPNRSDREVSRMIGELWNKLNEQERSAYQGKAMEDKERYQAERIPEQNVDVAEADIPMEEEDEDGDSSGSGESHPSDPELEEPSQNPLGLNLNPNQTEILWLIRRKPGDAVMVVAEQN